jgi:hypothetical protein
MHNVHLALANRKCNVCDCLFVSVNKSLVLITLNLKLLLKNKYVVTNIAFFHNKLKGTLENILALIINVDDGLVITCIDVSFHILEVGEYQLSQVAEKQNILHKLCYNWTIT